MDLLIGLDVGTSAVKGVLVSADGARLASARRATRLLRPSAGRVELEPEEHYRAVALFNSPLGYSQLTRGD